MVSASAKVKRRTPLLPVMRVLSLLTLLLLIVGVALLFHGFRIGEGEVYLFLIFPVFVSRGPASLAGSLLILVGIFVGFLSLGGPLSSRLQAIPTTQTPGDTIAGPPAKTAGRRKFGGVVLLGPVPIVFGSEVRITTAVLIMGSVLTVTLLLLFLTSLGG